MLPYVTGRFSDSETASYKTITTIGWSQSSW